MTPTTKQPAIDAVSVGPELNALVAEWVMGWERIVSDEHMPRSLRWRVPWDVEGEEVQSLTVFPFSTDANHVRAVEAEIERRGLSAKYIRMLMKELELDHLFGETVDGIHLFELVHATPEQRCRAAYRAVMG